MPFNALPPTMINDSDGVIYLDYETQDDLCAACGTEFDRWGSCIDCNLLASGESPSRPTEAEERQ